MVFFSCNVCGEALKKNQVDKHCMTKCRSCESVSCIDCGKDFWGNDYENHTKCISEDQKYSGKGYVAKVNKGEAKQDRWIEQVQIAIDKNKNNPRLRGPLESIKNYPNIPRKKNKFENFLQNSLRIHDRNLISKLWDALMEEAAKHMKPQSDTSGNTNLTNGKGSDTEKTQKENGVVDENVSEEKEDKKMSKRERKEERRKKMNKKEKKDKDDGETMESVESKEDGKPSKRKKKRKHSEEVEEFETNGKKRKRDKEEEEMEAEVEQEDEEEEPPLKKKIKFNWESVITEVLTSKGEISVKKLKKKVLSEYISQMGQPRSEEKLWTKFDKKLSKNPNFKVSKERVILTGQT